MTINFRNIIVLTIILQNSLHQVILDTEVYQDTITKEVQLLQTTNACYIDFRWNKACDRTKVCKQTKTNGRVNAGDTDYCGLMDKVDEVKGELSRIHDQMILLNSSLVNVIAPLADSTVSNGYNLESS